MREATMNVEREAPKKAPFKRAEISTANHGRLTVARYHGNNKAVQFASGGGGRIASGYYFFSNDLRYIADCLREIADDLDANG